jgi:hypothetical protein
MAALARTIYSAVTPPNRWKRGSVESRPGDRSRLGPDRARARARARGRLKGRQPKLTLELKGR